MKNLFLTAIVALGLVATSYAQDKGDVEFGVNVGYNSSNITNGGLNADAGSGFNAGVAADYYFSDRWSMKGKLIYDQKGWDNDNLGNGKTNINLDYLTVPVMANWHFGSKRNWYLNFGPYVGFLMSAEDSKNGIDLKDTFNTTDFGLAFGIGVKIPVSDKLKISLEYDGQSGFSDVFKDHPAGRIQGTRGAFNVGLNFMMK